ncbi:MAG: MFS transporter [Opitutaceae bacterium]|jgi:ACS family hexuronate transporter-like MFS transporter|nr:MFS transporter [Opitutaceae bacterium]
MSTLLTKTRSFFADATFRWFVLALLFCVSFLNYLDRTSLSVLQETLIREPALGLDRVRYADLVNAFTLCYAATLFFSGWVVDRIGPRVALFVFAGLWSVVTIGCGLAQGFASLFVFRALLGVAEPGLAPVSIRVATAWAPRNSRGLYMNLCSVGGSVGNIATAAIVVWLTTATGTWRWAFILPGFAGLVIAAVWWFCYREPALPAVAPPSATPEVSSDKLQVTRGASGAPAAAAPASPAPLTWPQLWGTRALWGVILARLVSDPVWYFILYWLPGYLEKQQSVAFGNLGVVGFIFLASFIGGVGASICSDLFARRHRTDPLLGRKNLLYAVSLAAPLCIAIPHLHDIAIGLPLLGAVSVKGITLVLLAFCVIAAICMSWMSGLAPIIAEIFPMGNVASVWGIAGTFGALGAFGFNKLLGRVGQPGFPLTLNQLFLIMGFMHLAAAAILLALVRRPKTADAQIV